MAEDKIKEYSLLVENIKKEISKIVVGQETIINKLLIGLISNGHVLVEGVPGTAKTLVIRALSQAAGCTSKRIQFTVDLLPTDIVGLTSYEPKKGFYTVKGPIFANFVIADEINRAPPKTQSALLEAMQEKQVTIGKKTFGLDNPFFVMATQNPIETAGTYPLPEAQVDRFLLKILISYPDKKEENDILDKNISLKKFEEYNLKPIVAPKNIIEMQLLAKKVFIKDEIRKYIINIVDATRNPDKYGIDMGGYIELGSSPRASIGLFIASKTAALLKGKSFVTPQEVKDVAHDIMRHRIFINYEGQSEEITPDMIIDEIISKVKVP